MDCCINCRVYRRVWKPAIGLFSLLKNKSDTGIPRSQIKTLKILLQEARRAKNTFTIRKIRDSSNFRNKRRLIHELRRDWSMLGNIVYITI